METSSLLAPAAVLILWSLMVLVWMSITRFKAFAKAGFSPADAPAGRRYVDVEPEMPERVNWKSHNYTHLMEQPTLFYASIAVLAIGGDTSQLSLILAWTYVLVRVGHSLWQMNVNTIPVRIILFSLSTLALLGLAIRGVWFTLF